jgi:hypothetical protein
MQPVKRALRIQVMYADGRRAPFTRVRVDTEFTKEGRIVRTPLAQVEDDDKRTDAFFAQYRLKDPSARLWLVLVDEGSEESQLVVEGKHKYVFGDQPVGHQSETESPQSKIIICENYTHTEEQNVTNTNIIGSNVNINSTLVNVTQSIGAMPHADEATKKELEKVVTALFEQLKNVPADKKEIAEAVSAQTGAVVEIAKQSSPNKSYLRMAMDTLKSGAQTLKDVAPVVSLVASFVAIITKLHGI